MSRRPPTKDFSGALVEHLLVSAELLIRDQRQIGALGQVVTNASVLTFAGAAFPRAVRVAEEDLKLEVGGKPLMLGHLLALVVSERLKQVCGDSIEFTRKGLAHAGGVFLWEVAKEGEARGAFNRVIL